MPFLNVIKEADVLKACIQYLEFSPFFAWRSNNTGIWNAKQKSYIFHGTKGVPDIIAIEPNSGRFIGIEVKGPKGKLSEHQKAFSDNVNNSNAYYCVVRSVEELDEDLTTILKENQP